MRVMMIAMLLTLATACTLTVDLPTAGEPVPAEEPVTDEPAEPAEPTEPTVANDPTERDESTAPDGEVCSLEMEANACTDCAGATCCDAWDSCGPSFACQCLSTCHYSEEVPLEMCMLGCGSPDTAFLDLMACLEDTCAACAS